ncbi:MBG domain-containing protein [Pontibacter sp. H249]|uniref:MBG domain-containing protein n=1 Tax=Pontibacter sp. H249 TaxID=3133420 RepID=UPI0030BA9472
MKTTFTQILRSIRPLLLLYFLFAFSSAQAQYKYTYAGEIGAMQQGLAQLSGPRDVAVDANGNIFIVNHSNRSISKFDSNGKLLLSFGGYGRPNYSGRAEGKFDNLNSIAVDQNGFVYAADGANNRIQKFDNQGNFILEFGTTGSAHGQFQQPLGVFVDKGGFLYVSDSQNNRIQKFNLQGNFLQSIGGTSGTDGYLDFPQDVAVDAAGNIYVMGGGWNAHWGHVKKFDSAGNFLSKVGEGSFSVIKSLAVAADGALFVGDGRDSNFRIQKFGSDGAFIKSIVGVTPDATFGSPEGITLDPSNNLYVTDVASNRVLKLNQDGQLGLVLGGTNNGSGKFVYPEGITVDASDAIYVTDNSLVQKFDKNGNFLMQFGSPGTGNGQFNHASGIAVDKNGNIYVVDRYNNRIQKFSATGVYLKQWGSYGTGNGQLNFPRGIAVDASSNVYVADTQNDRIHKFDSEGNHIMSFGQFGSNNGQFDDPSGILVSKDGQLLVVDFSRVQKFSLNGSFIQSFGVDGSQYNSIAEDAYGNIYTTIYQYSHKLQKYDSNGNLLIETGKPGIGAGEFHEPTGVAVTSEGRVFVVDQNNNRVQYYNRVGVPVVNIKQGTTEIINYSSYNFGDAVLPSGTKEVVFTVNNNGAAPLEITGISISGNHPNDFTVDQSETVTPLAEGASTTFKVIFKPTAAYSRSASMTITTNDANRSSIVVSLAGKGVKSDAVIENFENITKTYGDAPFDLAATSNSTGAMSYSMVTSSIAINMSGEGNKRISIIGTGTATIRAVVNGDANYNYAYKDITITVNKASQTITLQSPGDKTYGDTPISIPANSSAGLSINYTIEGPAMKTGLNSDPQLSFTGGGTVRLVATQAGNSNYLAATPVEYTFTVAKKELVATADNKSRLYGYSNPSLTVTYNGFVNGDNSTAITTAPSATTTATSVSDVGTYPITLSGGESSKYSFSYQSGLLTIAKAYASVSISNIGHTYDGQAKQVTVQTTPQGLAVTTTYNGSETAPSAAGTYSVVATVVDKNYQGSYTSLLSISKAYQTITLQSLGNKTYGDAPISLPATSSAGLNINYTVQGPATITGTAANPQLTLTGTGTVYVRASQEDNGNYHAATPVERSFIVERKVLLVKADDKERVFGESYPQLSISYQGFVSGEGVSVFTALPSAYTAATSTSDVGTYPITVSGGQAANYSLTYQSGTLTITKAPTALSLAELEQTYDGQPKEVMVFALPHNVAKTVTYNGSVTAPTAVGEYNVMVTVIDKNYYGFIAGTLRINKANQTIALQAPGNKTYGDAPINLPATSSAGLTIAYQVEGAATLAGTASNPQLTLTGAGTVRLTATQQGNANYNEATSVEHTFTVAKKLLVVIAEDKERVYGEAYPQLSITYQGFVAGENSSKLQTLPVAATVATSASDVGTYPITVTGGQAANYSFTYQNGTLTITKAPAALTLIDLEQTYDGQPKEVTVFSLPNSIALRITYNGSETPPTAAGSYNVAVTVTDKNYYGEIYGTLRINKLSQSIALQAPGNKTYGDAAVSLPGTSSANLNISYAVTGPAVITGTAANPQLSITGTGTVRVTATQAGNEQYTAALPVEHTFAVAKKELIVRAENKSRVYEQPNPQLTYTYDGFVNGESASVLEVAPVAATTATVNSDAGAYPITLSGGQAANYNFAYQAATLTVNKAEASITVSNLEQQYDGQPKQLTIFTFPQELPLKVTYNGSETAPTAAGVYDVVVTVVDKNYYGSITSTLTILNSTSIADLPGIAPKVILYPNPTTDGKVAIDGLKQFGKVQVTVTDAAGRKVWQTQTTTNGNGTVLLDLESKTTTGLYFIQVSDAQGKPTILKFIKK